MVSEKREEVYKKAVALKYNLEKDNAPKIVATGKGKIAEKIIQTARENDIPIESNKDVVDILARLNIGDEIPEKLYRAIAEILSFIYSLEDKDI